MHKFKDKVRLVLRGNPIMVKDLVLGGSFLVTPETVVVVHGYNVETDQTVYEVEQGYAPDIHRRFVLEDENVLKELK